MRRTQPKLPAPAPPSHPVTLPIACPCSFKPYPHLLHNELERARHEQPIWPKQKEITGWV